MENVSCPTRSTCNTFGTSRYNFHPHRYQEIKARRIFSKSFSDDLRSRLISHRVARCLQHILTLLRLVDGENTTKRVVTVAISVYTPCNVDGERRGRPRHESTTWWTIVIYSWFSMYSLSNENKKTKWAKFFKFGTCPRRVMNSAFMVNATRERGSPASRN